MPKPKKPDLTHIAAPLRPFAVATNTLIPDPANARKHSKRNLEAIAASLKRFGQRLPLVVQKQGMVVRAGSGRLLAATTLLGWTHIAAIVVDETEAEAVAFALADNRTAELAEWDDETLARLLASLPTELQEAAGFSESEAARAMRSLDAGPEEDEAPQPARRAVSRPEDYWLLGEHRLICGDCRDPGEVDRLSAGERADAVITDPPYGVEYEGRTSDKLRIQNDGDEGLEHLLRESLSAAASIARPGAAFYVYGPTGRHCLTFQTVLEELGLLRQSMVWVKNTLVMGHSDYHYRHENLYYGWKPGGPRPTPDRTQDSIWNQDRANAAYEAMTKEQLIKHLKAASSAWEIDRPTSSQEHPTMKPVELYTRAMMNSTRRGQVVYEPFAGSGTALSAAEQMGRICWAMEIDPIYADVCIRRWQALTGKEATLGPEAGGKTFAQVAKARKVKLPAEAAA